MIHGIDVFTGSRVEVEFDDKIQSVTPAAAFPGNESGGYVAP
jgi:hypothetical protein